VACSITAIGFLILWSLVRLIAWMIQGFRLDRVIGESFPR
jgi:hypothetical protein